jgi:glycosyltransferase involved in cell wall biosynthesis
MISIIVCCRNSDIQQSLKSNIEKTIGVEYELIIIDNSLQKHSIFSAYNLGVKKAKFPYLCFMHDDILYHTHDWGIKVIENFQDKNVGLIGIMGAHYLPRKPAYWFDSIKSENLILTNNNFSEKIYRNYYSKGSDYTEAVVCDGIWICILKRLFDEVKFDDKTYQGFHFYDMDISMQILEKGYSVRIINNVLIEHFKASELDKSFYDNEKLFFEKWKSVLPITKGASVDDSCKMIIDNYCDLKLHYHDLWEDRNKIISSKAYRIGRLILKPLKFIKKIDYMKSPKQ